MSLASNRIFRLVLCLLLAVLLCGCTLDEEAELPADTQPVLSQETTPTEPPVPARVGYVSAIAYGDGFLACGSGGRLDWIDMAGNATRIDLGTTENLLKVWSDDDIILVSGEHGILMESTDRGTSFHIVDCGSCCSTIYAAVRYEGMRYAAGEHGILYRENPGGWEAVPMDTESDLIDLVTMNYGMAIITADTDYMFSPDGLNWTGDNFNRVYEGLYPTYVFTRAIGAGGTFFTLGYEKERPNSPFFMFTETGEVWMHKALLKINGQEVTGDEDLRLHDLCLIEDQIFCPMDNGEVLDVTPCITCNETKIIEGAGDLWAAAAQVDGVLLCGEDFFVKVMDYRQIRQDKIGAEQAREDLVYGYAVVIDVREADELAESGYIPGSIHIPLAEVGERLPEVVPDPTTEVIFYCASGKRSQTATELAVEMGYTKVYNLGGLSDWPYEIVKD